MLTDSLVKIKLDIQGSRSTTTDDTTDSDNRDSVPGEVSGVKLLIDAQ
jgi:hypothetical protein